MNSFNWCDTEWMPRMSYGIFHKGQPWMWYDASQVWYDDNELSLYIEKKQKNIIYDGKEYHPQLAVGTIKSVQSYGYGTFSAEIQLPRGKNLWPAFWLVGEGKWPKGGEIDVMEAWSNKCCSYFRATIPQPPYLVPSWDTTTNIHWEDDGEHKYTGSRRFPLIYSFKNPTKHFVKYEVEWRQDSIKFKVDGKVIRTYDSDIAKRLNDTRQFVVFDLWTDGTNCTLETPMVIRNFKHEPL